MGQTNSRQEILAQPRVSQVMGNYWDFLHHIEDANEWAKLCPIPRSCQLEFRVVFNQTLPPDVLPLVWKMNNNVLIEVRRRRRHSESIWQGDHSSERGHHIEQSTGDRNSQRISSCDIIGIPKIVNVRQFYYVFCFLSDIRDCAAHTLSGPMKLRDSHGVRENADDDTFEVSEIECEICMDKVKEVVLPCTHSFCLNCYKSWCSQNRTCPICRSVVKCAEGEELWHLTSNECNDMRAYANDLASRIFEFLDKMPSCNTQAHGISSESVDVYDDYAYAMSVAEGFDQAEIERQIAITREDAHLALQMSLSSDFASTPSIEVD